MNKQNAQLKEDYGSASLSSDFVSGSPIRLSAMTGTVYEVTIANFQSGVTFAGGKVTGTLTKLTGSNAITDVWGEGYFVAFQANVDDFSTDTMDSVKVGLVPSVSSGLADLLTDLDKNGIFKITDKNAQKFVLITTYKTGEIKTQAYDLSELVLG